MANMTYMTQDVFDYFALQLAQVAYRNGNVGSTARRLAAEYAGYYEDVERNLEKEWLAAAAGVREFFKDAFSGPVSAERLATECQTLMNAIERYNRDGSVRGHVLRGPHPGIANYPTKDKVSSSVTNISYYFEALRVGDIDPVAAALPIPVSTPKKERRHIDVGRLRYDGLSLLVYLLLPVVAGPLLSYVIVSAMNLWDYVWIMITEGPMRADIEAARGFGNPDRRNIGSTLGGGVIYGAMLFLLAAGSRLLRGEWPHE